MSAQPSGEERQRERYGGLILVIYQKKYALASQETCSESAMPSLRHWQSCSLLLSKATRCVPLSLKSNWSFTPTPSFGSTDSWLSSRGTVPLTLSSDSNKPGAKADPAKQEESSENDVDALTFMQTIIMSFV